LKAFASHGAGFEDQNVGSEGAGFICEDVVNDAQFFMECEVDGLGLDKGVRADHLRVMLDELRLDSLHNFEGDNEADGNERVEEDEEADIHGEGFSGA